MFCKDLKVGDNVLLSSGVVGNLSIKKIDRETPKCWIVAGIKFNKVTGNSVGGNSYIQAISEEEVTELRKKWTRLHNIVKIKKFDFSTLEDCDLKTIVNTLNKYDSFK